MKTLLKAKEVEKMLGKMAEAIVKQGSVKDIAFVGIRSRGVPIAQRLAVAIAAKKGEKIPVGVLDITLYRDDLSRIAEHPVIKQTEIPFSLDSKKVYLVDDVLYTGRTIRCALDALFDLGR
ncbi:MAG: phosphoribosyltransferase family protein, partial [Deltaproteobacteria bacterium]|nr:phosphoribosyltransferase family protein [Deltaproteobacteria bacterium]